MMFVTLDQAKEHVREACDAEDSDITLKIEGASQMIANYLQSAINPFIESTGEPYYNADGVATLLPADIKTATLVLIGYLFRNRDEDPEKAFTLGNLPPAVTAQIYHRRPLSMA